MARIHNGNPIRNRQQLPWIVELKVIFGTFGIECAGSIISSNVILTAAHCLIKPKGRNIPVREVKVYYNSTINWMGPLLYAESMIPYPKYDEFHNYDVALLKVST
ncbi:hypothetical protein V5799_010137 [Amblyomma americanum]|uniref:Peptidase S1 domain-containing protein n=1 Tax=Amblyomma americanum TaxID=6943 RepID=A0AAQ4FA41_AMBAM